MKQPGWYAKGRRKNGRHSWPECGKYRDVIRPASECHRVLHPPAVSAADVPPEAPHGAVEAAGVLQAAPHGAAVAEDPGAIHPGVPSGRCVKTYGEQNILFLRRGCLITRFSTSNDRPS